jgi:hypothetical protein
MVKLPPNVIVLDPLLTPVPPYVDPIIVPFHVPDVIVPTVAKDDAEVNEPSEVTALVIKPPAEFTLLPMAVKTPVPVVVVTGDAPAPPPITMAFAAKAAEEAHVELELK